MSYSCTTTMWDLLNDLKEIINLERTNDGLFRSVQQVKLAGNKNPIAWPIISIVPLGETNEGILNGSINTGRRVRIEVYSYLLKSLKSSRQTIGLLDSVIGLFTIRKSPHWAVPSRDGSGRQTVFSVEVENSSSSSRPVPYKNGFLHRGWVDLNFLSRDDLHPDIYRVTPPLSETDTKTLTDEVLQVFKDYKASLLENKIRNFKNIVLLPQLEYPVTYLSLQESDRQRRQAGRDWIRRLYWLNYLEKTQDVDLTLERVLKATDKLKQILFANCEFNGKSIDYTYLGVEYGQILSSRDLLYGSSVQFITHSYENLLQPA